MSNNALSRFIVFFTALSLARLPLPSLDIAQCTSDLVGVSHPLSDSSRHHVPAIQEIGGHSWVPLLKNRHAFEWFNWLIVAESLVSLFVRISHHERSHLLER